MRGPVPFFALMVLAATVAGWAGSHVEPIGGDDAIGKELLLLPNGKHLKLASVGQAPVLADLIYLWAIQYYSVYDRGDRFTYVQHIFGDVIAELDPHYVDAYWMGALILTVEGDDIEGGLALLDQGIEKNPDKWMLPFLAGWEAYHAEQFDRAAKYFSMAEAIPDAPKYIRRTRIGMTTAKGDYRNAYQMWLELLQDPQSDAATINIAERQLRYLKIKIHVEELQSWVGKFRLDNERWPKSLNELVIRGYVDALPVDPLGRAYDYDPVSGVVAAQQDQLLTEGS